MCQNKEEFSHHINPIHNARTNTQQIHYLFVFVKQDFYTLTDIGLTDKRLIL